MKSWGNPGSKRYERKKKAHMARKAAKAAHMADNAQRQKVKEEKRSTSTRKHRHTFEAFCGNVGCAECFPLLGIA